MDIATLASADFFVGTFSSNVGMLVYQLRAASMEPETLNRLTVSAYFVLSPTALILHPESSNLSVWNMLMHPHVLF